MKTKLLRLPVLFASAGAVMCTASVVRAADAAIQQEQTTTQTQRDVINEPSGADRSYSSSAQVGGPVGSYQFQSYQGAGPATLDPDSEGNRVLHMYQRGRQAANSLDNQIKPDPIVVLPGTATFQSSYNVSQANEPAAAERQTTTSTTSRYSSSESTPSSTETTAALGSGTIIRGRDLVGMSVKNDQGQTIGHVQDVVVDLKTGRISYAVVAGTGSNADHWYAVPPTMFSRTGTERNLTWNIDREKLSTAPTIDKNNWNAAYQQDYINNVYNFYGVQPQTEVTEPAGSQKDQDHLYNKDQHQNQNQDLNKSDTDSSKLNSQGAQGAQSKSEATEQSDLSKSQPEKSAASSDVSKESAGAAAPSSTTSSSTEASPSSTSSPSSSSSSSSSDLNSSSTSQSGTSATSVDTSKQGANESAGASNDADKVQTAIKNDSSLSDEAKNAVQVSSENGKIVLKGTVKSDADKMSIMDKARSAISADKLDDQLKVESSSDTSSPDSSNKSNDSNSSSSDKSNQ